MQDGFKRHQVNFKINNVEMLQKKFKQGWLQPLRSESPSGKCAKLHAVAASNNGNHPTRSFFVACSRRLYMGVVRCAHPVRGESHVQRNTDGEVATTSSPFYNEPHRSHVFFVKAAPGTTFTFWSQHHYFAIRKPERQVRTASHKASRHIYVGVVLRAHPVPGESHIQRNVDGEVATQPSKQT